VTGRPGHADLPPILYQDEDLLAADKPEGLASIPGRGPDRDCLTARLAPSFGRLFVVHRLDAEVSGVILLARNAAAHRALNDQFAGREVRKTYCAVVHGLVRPDRGRIDRPIRAFGSGRMGIDAGRGKPSVTEFAVVERLARFTRVTAWPLTGRRHQIRVHFYALGHPIAGDRRYGDKATQPAFARLMLHAASVSFLHPDGRNLTVASPLPETFLAELRLCMANC
jgi:RluA family pseudouridine synthase